MKYALFALFVLLTTLPVSSQGSRECDAVERLQIALAIQAIDFGNEYQSLVAAMDKMDIAGGALLDVIADASALQEAWWTEAVPEFPDCDLASEMALIGGRVLDELLIASGVGQVAYTETDSGNAAKGAKLLRRFQHHIGQWSDLQVEFSDLVKEATSAK